MEKALLLRKYIDTTITTMDVITYLIKIQDMSDVDKTHVIKERNVGANP